MTRGGIQPYGVGVSVPLPPAARPRLRPRSHGIDWPSLLASCVMHLTAATLAIAVMRGCRTPPAADAPGGIASEWIEARLVLSEQPEPVPAVVVPVETTESVVIETDEPASDETTNESDAVESTADTEAAALGPAESSTNGSFLRPIEVAAVPQAAAGGSTAPPRRRRRASSGRSRPAPKATPTPAAETGLFGIRDRGRRLLYVIDRSDSMLADGAMRAAKAELLRSLDRLQPDQQFQVLFYSIDSQPLDPGPGRDRLGGLFRGTVADRDRVARQLDRIVPDGGTRHRPAVEAALRYAPDVIFFLTDGDRPGLTLVELDDIAARNAGRCRIHCIQFGRGGAGPQRTFLHRLADQNGGRYVYKDTTRLPKR